MKKYLLLFLFFVPLVVNARLAGQLLIDSLRNKLPQAKDDTSRILIMIKLSFQYESVSVDSGLMYGQQAFDLSKKIDWNKGLAYAGNVIGTNLQTKAEYEKAMQLFEMSLQWNKERGDERAMASNYGNIANTYIAMGNVPEGLKYLFEMLKIGEKINNTDLIASSLLNIGTVYFEMKNNSKAIEYIEKAIIKYKQLNDKPKLAIAYTNLGTCYYQLKQYEKALVQFNGSVAIYQELGYDPGIVIANIGETYLMMKQYDKALEYATKGLKMAEESKDAEGVAGSWATLGNIYLAVAKDTGNDGYKEVFKGGKKANMATAISKLKQAEIVAGGISVPAVMLSIAKSLAEAYKLDEQYKPALKYAEIAKSLEDSMFSTDNKIKFANLETKRETDLKEKQIEINKAEARQKRSELVFLGVCIVLLLAIVFLVVRNYNKQKRTNVRLAMSNKELVEEKQRSDDLAAELKESLVQKEELARQLEQSAAIKSKFFANISHELRTPVTLLTGMLELVRDREVTAGADEKLRIAYDSSRKLQYMVEEILDLSKLESGTSELRTKPIEVAPMLKRMVHAFETLIEKEQLLMEYKAGNIDGVYIQVDENKFEKIVNNLVYNAIKFNVKGGYIRVAAELLAEHTGVIIRVDNSGAGINPQDLPHVFERFYQGDTKAAYVHGAGIGLSLVKEFTELMGGTVDVSSDPAAGTTFMLQFPIAREVEIDVPVPEEGLISTPDGWEQLWSTQTILLVEDNTEMRYYLKEVLGETATLVEAGNGKEALHWLEHNTPDLIISDIMMPEMDGREFISRLKKDDAYKKIPIITLTALADKVNQVELLQLGIDDYIIKPFNATELRVRVYNLLNNLHERRQFAQQPAEPDDVPAESTEADQFRNMIKELVLSRIKNINVSVFDLAYEMAMSERQLYRMAKSLTGCTPAQLIKEVRLQKAYELLLSGDVQKLDYVARQVGFETTAYFSRQFFERFGKRPTEFL